MTSLPNQIRAAWDAYQAGTPTMSDEAFDALVAKLRAQDPKHGMLSYIGRAGDVTHKQPMLSLEKTYTFEGVQKWASSLANLPCTICSGGAVPHCTLADCIDGMIAGVVMMPKLDGLALALHYQDGRLVRALTRGDGTKGEDVTQHALRIANIPKYVSAWGDDYLVEVRGEVLLPKSVKVATNRRNVAAGLMGRKEAGGDYPYEHLKFVAYDLHTHGYDTLAGSLHEMEQLGFEAATCVFFAPEMPIENMEKMVARMRELPTYDLDGIVFSANIRSERDRLGATSHHPRWAIAYKFAAEAQQTILRDVVWQVGRTGVLTPVAIVDPVQLDGVTVTRCTLHNRSKMAGMRVGSVLSMSRRGGVIPHIESIVEEGTGREFPPMPNGCPSCGSSWVSRSSVDVSCSRPLNCRGALTARFEHFLKTLDVDGVGPAKIAEWLEQTAFVEPADMWHMWKMPSHVPLATLLQALGVEGLGESASTKLSRALETIQKAMAADAATIGHALDGHATSQDIYEGLQAVRHWVTNLLAVVTVDPELPRTGSFAGKSVVFTGEIKAFTRPVAQKLVRERGGDTPSGVSKKVTYLVAGDAETNSTKAQKARKLGTVVLDEAQFLEMVGPLGKIKLADVEPL